MTPQNTISLMSLKLMIQLKLILFSFITFFLLDARNFSKHSAICWLNSSILIRCCLSLPSNWLRLFFRRLLSALIALNFFFISSSSCFSVSYFFDSNLEGHPSEDWKRDKKRKYLLWCVCIYTTKSFNANVSRKNPKWIERNSFNKKKIIQ